MNNRVTESQLRDICVSVEKRVGQGEQRVADQIFESQPGIANDPEAAMEVVYREYVALENAGTEPSLSVLLDRYPQWREQLSNLFEVHNALAEDDETTPAESSYSAAPESVGATIGKYKLLQEIGEGGFGVVFMAEQLEPVRRKVALKIIKPGMDTRAAVARFEAERQALALMEHPNISRVLDAGATANGRPYFVMDLVKGVPITEFCDKKNLSTVDRLKLFATVCYAVQHAHNKGIVHRDLKPSNVMITLHDGEPVPKIIDFGIAKALNQQLTEKTLFTRYGQMLGTPMYMSPEQAEMSGLDIDTRSDVYSLGVLLYELLIGAPPVSAERLQTATYADMIKIIVEEDAPTPGSRLQTLGDTLDEVCHNRDTEPRQLFRLLRSDLEQIVMKAVEKDRKRRYETVSDLARDIDRYLNDEPVQASSPSLLYRMQKFVRRNRALVYSTAAVVLALALGLVFAVSGLINARHQRRLAVSAQTEERHQRQRAEHEEENAKTARDAERDQRLRAETNLYFQRVSRAHREWISNNLRSAVETLAACSETNRGWEWHYLQRLCHPSKRTLEGHTNTALRVVISPDGRLIASCSSTWNNARPGKVILWDRETGQQLHVFGSQPGGLRSLSFSPDSKRLAIVNNLFGGLSVWNVDTGSVVYAQAGRDFESVDFSPTGGLLATGGHNGEVRIFDAVDGSQLRTLKMMSPASVFEVCFSPTGQLIAAVNSVNVASVWDAGTGQLLHQWSGAGNRTVDFSPDGSLLATGGYSGRHWGIIKIYRLKDLKSEVAAEHYTNFGVVSQVRFSPDGQLLAITGSEPLVRVWEPLTGRERFQFKAHQGIAYGVAFGPDGRQLATAGHNRVRMWKLSENKSLARPDRAFVKSIAFSPDSRHMALAGSHNISSGRGNKTVQIWRLWDEDGDHELATVLNGFDQWMTTVSYDPSGTRIAAAGDKGGIHVWSVLDGESQLDLNAHVGKTNSIGYSSDGLRLASGGQDGFIRVWDAESGLKLNEWTGNQTAVNSVVQHPTRDLLVSAGEDGSIKLWNVRSGVRLQVLAPASGVSVTRTTISQDGRLLATGDETGKIQLWALKANSAKLEESEESSETSYTLVHTSSGHTQTITGLSFHPSNNRLASISMDGSVITWDVGSFNEAIRLTPVGQNTAVLAVAFSPDGERLAASRGNAITVWNSRRLSQSDTDIEGEKRRSIAWHEQMCRECTRDLNWLGAVFHYDRLLILKPEHPQTLADRGLAHAALEHWAQARDDLLRAHDLGFSRSQVQYVLALALLHLGDHEGSRNNCLASIKSVNDSYSAATANSAAWVCALGPNSLEDYSHAIELSERALKGTTGFRRYAYSNTLGTLLLRSGQYEQAIDRIHRGLAFAGKRKTPVDWLVLAMAHQRLGHPQTAKRWFNKAAWELSRLQAANVPDPIDWSSLCETQLLLDEVAALIQSSPQAEKSTTEPRQETKSHAGDWLGMGDERRQLIAWHQNALNEAEDSRNALAAMVHLEILIESQPGVSEHYVRRSKAYAQFAPTVDHAENPGANHFNDSRKDLTRAIEIETGEFEGILLTGSGEHVVAPHIPFDTLKEFTIEAWVNRPWQGTLLTQGARGDPENSIWLATVNNSNTRMPTTFGWEARNGKQNFIGTLPPLVLPWNHIAIVFDGLHRSVFVNGRLIESKSVSKPGELDRDQSLSIGASIIGPTLSATGRMRCVRISDTALYSKDFLPESDLEADASTLLLYDFAADRSWIETGVVQDRSSHHHNGRIRNAWWLANP